MLKHKNRGNEAYKCRDINIHASTAVNSSLQMTIHALSAAESIQLDPSDAQNAETQ
jgi:hypothetical protein